MISSAGGSDRRPVLMIRIADMQNNLYIAEPHVRLYMATSAMNNVCDAILLILSNNFELDAKIFNEILKYKYFNEILKFISTKF